MALIFSTLCVRSFARSCSIYPIRWAIMKCVLSSPEDPLAMYRYRISSGIVSRSFPSAMLAAIETADLRSWSLKAEILVKVTVFRDSVYLYRQRGCLLPNFKILKTSDSHLLVSRVPQFSLAHKSYTTSPFRISRSSRLSRESRKSRPVGTAPPFHLQFHIAGTTLICYHARKRRALSGQAESQDLFPWHSRLNQLFFTGCRVLEIGDQHPIKLPSANPVG